MAFNWRFDLAYGDNAGAYSPPVSEEPPHTPPSMTTVGQGTVRRMTQFPVPLLRTNVKPARSKRVRVPL